ncbi:hypothetical protein SAMN04487958_110107 [Vreelandella subterranea]|uniref:DUF2622 domain-containing protein n=1 Tax=Vreelandella subterranea TaxID=416874 RepID=A0A1H9VRH7_9GAMM|nr:hypothetical protein [Halomonas subterranea]SES24182.1 hypothetical protein SAMN04487958_110107 [Halomonas subterranea]
MASFTVRIVLKDGDWDDYEKLYARMEMKGFSKEIEGSSGQVYELPDAEYIFDGAATREDVFEKAKAAAGGVGPKYSILVTESKGRTWCGLEKA